MRNTRNDDYEYLGLLLEGVQGSLSEERAKSGPKNYTFLLKRIRSLNKRFDLRVHYILKNPSILNDRLAETAALIPGFTADLSLKGIGSILGKDQYKKLRQILIYLSLADIPEYIKFILEQPFLKLVPRNPERGIQAELVFLTMIVSLNKPERVDLLNKIYSKNNLQKMKDAGESILSRPNFFLRFFDYSEVKVKQRRRGYNDKGSSVTSAERKRRKSMNEINEEIERRKKEILLKQLELFERNLDRILQMESDDLSRKEIKEIIRNQNEEFENLNHEPEETNNE